MSGPNGAQDILSTSISRQYGHVFRGFMHVCAEYANVCLWPKADIETESKSPLANVCFGEKSGHSAREPGLIRADFT